MGNPEPQRWMTIRVELVSGHGERLWPRPGRVLIASSQHSFRALSQAIDAAFARWDLAHLWAFDLADGTRYTAPTPWEPDLEGDDPETPLAVLDVGDQFVYEFDFGDSWLHLCEVLESNVEPTEVLGIVPSEPSACWGWGTIPDQHHRAWAEDDGSGKIPPDPGWGDLPAIGPFAYLRRLDEPRDRNQVSDYEPGPHADDLPASPDRPHLRLVSSDEIDDLEVPFTQGLTPDTPMAVALELFLANEARTLAASTFERRCAALATLDDENVDRPVAGLAVMVDEVYDDLRVRTLGSWSPADLDQLGVSLRKFARWAHDADVLEPDLVDRIVERTKQTGGELTAAIRFDEALRHESIIAKVTRRYSDLGDTEPDECHAHSTWVIAEIGDTSITLTSLVDEADPIRVELGPTTVSFARPGWMLTATAERRGDTWTLDDVGKVSV